MIGRAQLALPAPGLALAVLVAAAQPAGDAADAGARAAAIAARVGSAFDCVVELQGSPRAGGFAGEWLVPYTAVGPACDDAQAELGRLGSESDVAFMRRPSLAQLRQLLGPMIRSAELASGCRIAMRGRPAFDAASAQWFVHVSTDGSGCSAGVRDLAALARDLEIVVLQDASRTLERR